MGSTATQQLPKLGALSSRILAVSSRSIVGNSQTVLQAEDLEAKPSTSVRNAYPASVSWRFDGNGHFPGIRPPTQWRGDQNVLWKTSVDLGGYSSPIVVKDRVFVTAEMGSLLCLDLGSGNLLWKKDLFEKDSPDIPAELSGKLVAAVEEIASNRLPLQPVMASLFFTLTPWDFACYDLDGHQQWMRIIETAEEEILSASPIFVGDRIIVHWGCLLALNAKDGRTLWKAPDALPTYGTPGDHNNRRGGRRNYASWRFCRCR